MSIISCANSGIMQIDPYVGGKAKSPALRTFKLSSNENPLGCSKAAMDAYKACASSLNLYPDGGAANLRFAIAQTFDLQADRITCGAGSDEVIGMLSRGFLNSDVEVIASEYGFLMYKIAAQVAGAHFIEVPDVDYRVSVDNIISAITPRTRMIFIASPNNPTGTYTTDSEIYKLMQSVPSDVIVVLDCAYSEFVNERDYSSYFELTHSFGNLVILRTFSKIYGLAALRIGFCYTSREITDVLQRVRGPFNVSTPAQNAAVAALGDNDFVQLSVQHNAKFRSILCDAMVALPCVRKIIPSFANFLLVDFGPDCDSVYSHLFESGFIVRQMHAYKLPTHLRITVGTEEGVRGIIKSLGRF